MEAVKKYWFWSILISILTVFAMSYNANAIDLNINLDNYSIGLHQERQNINLRLENQREYCEFVSECRVYQANNFSRVIQFRAGSAYSFTDGDIIVWRVFIGSQSQYGDYTSVYPFIQRNYTTNQDYFVYLGNNSQVVDANMLYSTYALTPNPNDEYFTNVVSNYKYLKVVDYYFRVLQDGRYYVGFDSTNYQSYAADIFSIGAYSTSDAVYFKSLSITQYKSTESKENKEVEQKTQEAVDESEAAGGSSSTDAQSGTTGLLSAISGAVNVITSASPTNCRINGNMGNLDIGQLDLCANPAPAFITTIGSLILILMCVPLAISLFNRFIAIFRSFQS